MAEEKKKKTSKHSLAKTFSNFSSINAKAIKLVEQSNSWITVKNNIKFLKNGKIIGELEFTDVGVKGHKIKVTKVYQGLNVIYKTK